MTSQVMGCIIGLGIPVLVVFIFWNQFKAMIEKRKDRIQKWIKK